MVLKLEGVGLLDMVNKAQVTTIVKELLKQIGYVWYCSDLIIWENVIVP